jgi:uncharacterized protein (TIGR02391 family)
MTQGRSAPPAQPRSANLSPAQVRMAISQLKARIGDLRILDVGSISRSSDPPVAAIESKIDGTLARIYGADTADYVRLRAATQLDTTSYRMSVHGHGGTQVSEIQAGVDRGRNRAIALLTEEVALLKEQLGEEGDSQAHRAIRAYSNLELHSEIARAASDLYRDGHYAPAILSAVTALNGMVRLRSSVELDGTALMQRVFSPNGPVLRFNDLADQSDKDEQQGFMMMFSGAVAGLRNPRAHKLIKDDPERALEFIAYVSLLAKLLDGAKKTPAP